MAHPVHENRPAQYPQKIERKCSNGLISIRLVRIMSHFFKSNSITAFLDGQWVTWGRFHQLLCAKQKVAGANRSAKNLPFNFTNKLQAKFVCWNLAKSCSPFAKFVRQKSFSSCACKKALSIVLVKLTPKSQWPITEQKNERLPWPPRYQAGG